MKERPTITEPSWQAGKPEKPRVEDSSDTDAIYPPENESMYAHSGDDD